VTAYSPSTPNGLVVGDNGGTAIPYEDVQVIYASETLYTNTSIGVAGTVNATQANVANGSAYGIRTLTIDPSLVADTTNGQALANYYLDIYDNPQLRFEAVTFGLSGLSAAQQVSVLNSEIYTAVSMTYTPSALGSAITAYQRVVGVNHTITPDSHKVTLNLAEFGNRFRLDSATYGILNTNILGY
jgi:hypothetical protein